MNNGNGPSVTATVLAVVVGLVVGCSSSNSPSPSTSQVRGSSTTPFPAPPVVPAPPPQTPVAAPPVGIGQEVVDGTFAFTVDSVDAAKEIELPAQGIFVVVMMRVKNIGTSQQLYSADHQRLLDSEGREYSPDLRLMAMASVPVQVVHVDINPVNSAAVVLYFDVPEGTVPSQYVLLLHGSRDSPGVTVNLK